MNSITSTVKVFKDFIRLHDIDAVKKHFEIYSVYSADFENDLFNTPIILTPEELDEVANRTAPAINRFSLEPSKTYIEPLEIIDFLLLLNINPSLWSKYLTEKPTIYKLLTELAKDNEHSAQIHILLDLIEEKRQANVKDILLNLALAALVFLPVLGLSIYEAVKPFLSFVMQSTTILPMAGVAFSIIGLCVNIYLNHSNARKPQHKIYRDDFFLLASSGLNVCGKILLLSAQAVISSVAASLFVISSLVECTKELINLIELDKAYQNPLKAADNLPHIVAQQKIRHYHDYAKQRNTVIINLTAALCLSALVIGCCFFPPGLFMTIATTATLATIYLAKKIALTVNENVMTTKLKNALENSNEDSDHDLIPIGNPAPQAPSAQPAVVAKPVAAPVLPASAQTSYAPSYARGPGFFNKFVLEEVVSPLCASFETPGENVFIQPAPAA